MAYLSEFLRFDSGEAEGGSSKNEQQVEGDPQLRRRRRTSRHSRALCHSLFLSFFTSSPASFMTWGWTQASAVFWLWFCFLQNSVSSFSHFSSLSFGIYLQAPIFQFHSMVVPKVESPIRTVRFLCPDLLNNIGANFTIYILYYYHTKYIYNLI